MLFMERVMDISDIELKFLGIVSLIFFLARAVCSLVFGVQVAIYKTRNSLYF